MTEKLNCDGCDICCNHVALEIDKPETKEDFDYILWYLLHKDVYVYIDNEGDWLLEFKTPCKELNEEGVCESYEKRPDICKKYDLEECEKFGEGQHYKEKFTCRKDLQNYIDKKGIKFK